MWKKGISLIATFVVGGTTALGVAKEISPELAASLVTLLTFAFTEVARRIDPKK